MLESKFRALIDKIVEIENSHHNSSDPKIFNSRNWERIFSEFDGWLVLKCYTKENKGGYWVYPFLYPKQKIQSLKDSLPRFSFTQPSAAYGEVIGGGKHWLEPYWKDADNFTDGRIPLLFSRLYHGYPPGKENYYEFNQLVTHPLNLHQSSNKNAYCITDDYGEEVEKIKIIDNETINLILMRRKTLEKLLYLGDWYLVRYFSFSRYMNEDFHSYQDCETETHTSNKFESIYEVTKYQKQFIEFRGAEIFKPLSPKKEILNSNFEDPETQRQKYAEFIVHDWKNQRLLESYSIKPENFANYFTESDLPFETSPIFFDAEVLDKYKNNPAKYDLKERSISCRGGWYLKTYDVNEHNQVHTYAGYLSRLPYKEQLHWLQYNEEPKGGISKRALQTDFEGRPPDEMSKIRQLKSALENLKYIEINGSSYSVWLPKRGDWEKTSKNLHYVNTENPNQWHDYIISLCNVTNEGFQIKELRKIASYFGEVNNNIRTLGLIKSILKSSGNEDEISKIHGTLNELQIKRSKGKVHGTWDTPSGSLIEDSRQRLDDVIQALEMLFEVFSSMKLPDKKE